MSTYRIEVSSCQGKPITNATFCGVPKEQLPIAWEKASKAFESVVITDEETGEIICNRYIDSDWFFPIFSYGEMIDMLSHICYDS